MVKGFLSKVDDDQIYYEIYNPQAASTIIFLHGNCESGKIFYPWLKYFPQDKIVLLDTLGHGRSSLALKHPKLNFADLAEDLLLAVAQLQLTNIRFILGYSDGANILLELLTRKIKLADKFILISPNLDNKDLKPALLRQIKRSSFFRKLCKTRNNRNKTILNNLMLQEPHYNLGDFVDYLQEVMIIASDHDCVSLAPLRALGKIYHRELIIIAHTNHFNLLKNSQLWDTIQKL